MIEFYVLSFLKNKLLYISEILLFVYAEKFMVFSMFIYVHEIDRHIHNIFT